MGLPGRNTEWVAIPSPGTLPDPEIELSLALQAGSLLPEPPRKWLPRRTDSPALPAPDILGGGRLSSEPGGLVTAHRHRGAAGGLSGTHFWEI